MKKIISCMLLLSIMMVYVSCNSDSYDHFTLKTPPDTMELNIIQENVVLNEDMNDQVAITFAWNKGADRGAGTEITYYFKMDIANNSLQTSIPKVEVSADNLSISFTHKELNDLIISRWKIHPGDAVDLEAEIIADVTTYPQYLRPEISKLVVNVISYAPKPKDLFLLGTAVQNEDPQKATKLTSMTIDKEYTWKGNMKEGTFKFIEKIGELLPSYNKGADENTLVHRTQAGDPDNLFTVGNNGLYAIYVNTEDMKMSLTPIPYPEVYMVGNGCPAGWDIGNAIPLEWDYVRAAYVYEGELHEGEIKLPLWKDWSADTLMPPVHGTNPGGDPTVALHPGGQPDHKWIITEAGTYRMILDVNAMTITFEKL